MEGRGGTMKGISNNVTTINNNINIEPNVTNEPIQFSVNVFYNVESGTPSAIGYSLIGYEE